MRRVGVPVAVVSLSAVGLSVLSIQDAQAAAAGKLTICHANASVKNPYTENSVAIDATLHGHTGHIGPLYPSPGWGDIIPPFTYTDPKTGITTNYPGQNWNAAGQQILANGCDIPTTVNPGAVTITQSVCSGGVATVPSVTFPNTTGVTYSINPAPAAGTTATVTATATAPAYWFQSPGTGGWTYVDQTHETMTVTFTAAPVCSTTVVPVAPTVTQSACSAGGPTAPTLALPSTPGISYSVAPPGPYAAGQTVVVTATADATHTFSPPATGGWVYVDSTHETLSVTFDPAPVCHTVVTPDAVTVTQSVCAGNPPAPTMPTLTLPTGPPGVTYSATLGPYTPGQTVVVTATADASHMFLSPGTGGWVYVDSTHETYTITFTTPVCAAVATVAPVAPTVDDPQCAGSPPAATAPTLTLAGGPAGVTYTVSAPGPYVAGQTVTVTATADATVNFAPPATGGWVYVDSKHETYTVTFGAQPTCTPTVSTTVSPVNPTIGDPQCVGAPPVASAPTLTFATGPAGVTYTASPAGPYVPGETVTVTATAGPGVMFAPPGTGGWVYVDSTHETYTHTFGAAPICAAVGAAVAAAPPQFTDPSCSDTGVTAASYVIGAPTGVDYYDGSAKLAAGRHSASAGSTVTITAVARPGFVLSGPRTFTHTFAVAPTCAATAGLGAESLASTGVAVLTLIGFGGAFVVIGLVLTVGGIQRRRRPI